MIRDAQDDGLAIATDDAAAAARAALMTGDFDAAVVAVRQSIDQFRGCSPEERASLQRDLDQQRQQLAIAMNQRLQLHRNRLAHIAQMLDSLSPLGVLARGYAIVTDSEGAVLRDAGKVAIGDEVEARLASGRLGLTVRKVE